MKDYNYFEMLSNTIEGWGKLLDSTQTDPTKCQPFEFNFEAFQIMISVIKFLTKTGIIFK